MSGYLFQFLGLMATALHLMCLSHWKWSQLVAADVHQLSERNARSGSLLPHVVNFSSSEVAVNG